MHITKIQFRQTSNTALECLLKLSQGQTPFMHFQFLFFVRRFFYKVCKILKISYKVSDILQIGIVLTRDCKILRSNLVGVLMPTCSRDSQYFAYRNFREKTYLLCSFSDQMIVHSHRYLLTALKSPSEVDEKLSPLPLLFASERFECPYFFLPHKVIWMCFVLESLFSNNVCNWLHIPYRRSYTLLLYTKFNKSTAQVSKTIYKGCPMAKFSSHNHHPHARTSYHTICCCPVTWIPKFYCCYYNCSPAM